MSPIPLQCAECRHYQGELKCDAFLNGIPYEVMSGEFDHTEKYPGQDNDIVYEPADSPLEPSGEMS